MSAAQFSKVSSASGDFFEMRFPKQLASTFIKRKRRKNPKFKKLPLCFDGLMPRAGSISFVVKRTIRMKYLLSSCRIRSCTQTNNTLILSLPFLMTRKRWKRDSMHSSTRNQDTYISSTENVKISRSSWITGE